MLVVIILLLLCAGPEALTQDTRPRESQNGTKPSVRAESADRSNQISENQLVGLPLNGRSYSQLATLQAGVSDPSAASGSRGVSSGGGLTVSGGRRSSNIFLLDGINIMNSDNGVPRSAAGVQLGSDAVLQVQVFGTQYNAEYGRGSGGVLNSITRSGSPQFHGDFFEFFRNSKLDSRNFFDLQEPPPFKRNQFGFTLTGPLVKDRTFLMGSFEALRDRLSNTVVEYFPNDQARAGFPDKNGMPTIPVFPTVQRYLDLYPRPNGPSLEGGIGENRAPVFLPTNESFFTVRVDHQLSLRDSMFVHYTFDDATSAGTSSSSLFTTLDKTRQQYLTLVYSHIFNPSMLNAFRLGYTRPVDSTESFAHIKVDPSLFFIPDAPQFGQITIPAVSSLGPNSTLPEANVMNTFQFGDDLLYQKGKHLWKFGFDAHRYRIDSFNNARKSGTWAFNSLESFLRGGPEGTTVGAALPGSDGFRADRQTYLGFYLQDVYNIQSGLRVDLGLRYEFATLIRDREGRDTYLPDPLHDTMPQTGRFVESNPSLRDFSPRVGLSWSPLGNQSLVIRGGFGIYYDQLLKYVVSKRRISAPFFKRVIRTNFDSTPFFPNALLAVAGVPIHVETLDYRNMADPMVLRYNFSVEQELPGGWSTAISYVGARGNHLYRSFEANLFPVPETRSGGTLFFPAQCNKLNPPQPNPTAFCRTYAGPVNPVFETISITGSDAQSFYNSLRVTASKRIGQGLSLQGSYTYSKSVDDASDDSGTSEQYGWMRTLERSLSDFDVRHRLTFNYFYNLPFGTGRRWGTSGILSHLFGNWRLGGIASFRTGTPDNPAVSVRTTGYLFAAKRPHLLPGQSKNPTAGVTAGCGAISAGQELGSRELYFDPCVYGLPAAGTLGNAGRNTIIAPSVFNMDVSLQKEFSIDSKRRLQFRAEFFNLPNHTNFSGVGSTTIFRGASGRRNSSAGIIGNTATTARQIQFALRFSF